MTSLDNDEVKHLREEVKELKLLLQESMALLKESASKMNNHINFVERIYSTLRFPLDYITKKLGYPTELPPNKLLLLTDEVV